MLHWYDFFFTSFFFLNWGAIYNLPIITHVHGCVCCTQLCHTVYQTVRTGLVHCLTVPFPDQWAAVINENVLICPCHFQSTWNISLPLCLCVALHPYLHMWNIMLHLCLCVTLHPYLHVMCPFTGLPLAVSSDVPTSTSDTLTLLFHLVFDLLMLLSLWCFAEIQIRYQLQLLFQMTIA